MTQSQKRALDAVQNMIKAKTDEVTCDGDKNCIVSVSNTTDVRYNGDKNCITSRDVSDCITYTGNFRDEQTSFNDK